MIKTYIWLAFLLVVQLGNPVLAGLDFQGCLNDVRSGSWGLDGAVDANGVQVTNLTKAVGISYQLCLKACGSGTGDFDWKTFSQQLTAWLLPWLGLISQIPYGTRDGLSDLLAVLLTIGSPTLAAYSLALAILSNRWMVKRFQRSTHPNSYLAAQTLGNLQQVALDFPNVGPHSPYLVNLRDNGSWWSQLSHELEYSVPRWTFASIISVFYMVLADIITWSNLLGEPLSSVRADVTGEIISSLWLCFLPIMIGYLLLSPKTDWDRISRAFDRVDVLMPGRRNFPLSFNIRTAPRDTLDEDETCSAPIFYYARVFPWLGIASKVIDSFNATSQHPKNHDIRDVLPGNQQAVDRFQTYENSSDRFAYDVFSIVFRSALLAVLLQWGTTGAAIMADWYTPTKGLGCRSGAVLLYGSLSTLIWLFFFVSSILAHSYKASQTLTTAMRLARVFSIVLRHLAKTLAAFNAVWLFLSTLIHLSNLDNTCYCASDVLSLRDRGYAMIEFTADIAKSTVMAWAGGLIFSSLIAVLFLLAIGLLRKHPEQPRADIAGLRSTGPGSVSEEPDMFAHRSATLATLV